MNIFLIMAISLFFTLLIELVGAYFLGIRSRLDFINIFLVNVLTNPLVVSISFFINIWYGLFGKRIAMLFLESGAFLIEGFLYKRVLSYQKRNGYVVSFVLNVCSYFIGIVLNFFLY